MRKRYLWLLTVLVTGLGLLTMAGTVMAASLANDDCVKCHAQPPADIEAKGLSHKTAVGCQDCHNGHPPAVRKIIPLCSQCHEGTPHFALKNCNECHTNPHTPKVISYGKNVTEACLTCHNEQIKQLKAQPSKHSRLFCSTCHESHGKIPSCTQCHKPHAADMPAGDCKKCHQAHMPKAVSYVNDQIKNSECGACHKRAFELLAASPFKHKEQGCTVCHADKHRALPTCQTCHGEPHPAPVMIRFKTCGACHSIAHDLYGSGQNKKAAAPAAPVKN